MALPFTPEQFFRVFTDYNRAGWPWRFLTGLRGRGPIHHVRDGGISICTVSTTSRTPGTRAAARPTARLIT